MRRPDPAHRPVATSTAGASPRRSRRRRDSRKSGGPTAVRAACPEARRATLRHPNGRPRGAARQPRSRRRPRRPRHIRRCHGPTRRPGGCPIPSTVPPTRTGSRTGPRRSRVRPAAPSNARTRRGTAVPTRGAHARRRCPARRTGSPCATPCPCAARPPTLPSRPIHRPRETNSDSARWRRRGRWRPAPAASRRRSRARSVARAPPAPLRIGPTAAATRAARRVPARRAVPRRWRGHWCR
ncbi:hypothetical protein BCO18430_06742 [Burkholderia contaminans]|nr:hypothetical protein BCO18430_06742 [Burkholderia contaminans]